jgi:hypothetical protein
MKRKRNKHVHLLQNLQTPHLTSHSKLTLLLHCFTCQVFLVHTHLGNYQQNILPSPINFKVTLLGEMQIENKSYRPNSIYFNSSNLHV